MSSQGNSTQAFVEVGGIRNGVVVLKSGYYRSVLQVDSINFDLKNEEERNVIIFRFQSFLNSLHFDIQILIKSHKLDLAPYLAKTEKLAEKQTNPLLKNLTYSYTDFVNRLVSMSNIMKKNFYVVIPYAPLNTGSSNGIFDFIMPKNKAVKKISDREFQANAAKLTERTGIVASGLANMGLRCKQLNTEEIIELLYQTYNPEVSFKERLNDADLVTSEIVASDKEKIIFENNQNQEDDSGLVDNLQIIKENSENKEEVDEQKSFSIVGQEDANSKTTQQ